VTAVKTIDLYELSPVGAVEIAWIVHVEKFTKKIELVQRPQFPR
jgi:hypothetical protein